MNSNGHQVEKYGKKCQKIDILAYFGTPGGLLKSEQFFKHDIFAHLGLF